MSFQSPFRVSAWILLAAVVVNMATGVFPFAPIEADSLSIINGATLLARGEVGPDSGMLYRYSPQAGTYRVAAALVRLTGMSALTALGLVALLGALAFVVLTVCFVRRLAGVSLLVAMATVLFFQEASTALFYSNSVNAAAALAMGGVVLFLFASRGCAVVSGVLFGLGAWMRADAILMMPCVLAGALGEDRRRAVIRVAATVATAAVVYLVMLYGSGGSLAAVMSETSRHSAEYGGHSQMAVKVGSWLSFFTLPVAALGLWGLGSCVRKRDGRSLWLFVLGCLPTAALYGPSLLSPKYLYYALPLVALMVALGFRSLIGMKGWPRSVAAVILAGLLAGQYALGICYGNPEWFRDPYPQVLRILHHPFGKYVRVGLGAGFALGTCDGLRLSSGILYAPHMWRESKQASRTAVVSIRDAVEQDEGRETAILSLTWTGNKVAEYVMLQLGYSLEDAGVLDDLGAREYVWEKDGREIRSIIDIPAKSPRELEAVMRALGLKECYLIYGGGGGDLIDGTGRNGGISWEEICQGSHILKLRAFRVFMRQSDLQS